MFQVVFATTAPTIVSGAMAQRTKFSTYFRYSFALTAFICSAVGHWMWGVGLLAKLGMWDIAGSTVVHSTSGWLALIGAIMQGPRSGKYSREGKPQAIPAQSLPMAAPVAITAACAFVSPLSEAIVGLAAGVVVFSVILLHRVKVDDPVAAVSVHGK